MSQCEFRFLKSVSDAPRRLANECTASSDPSWSTSLQRRVGCSAMTVRPSPQSAACTGSTGSPDSVATARSVMIHSPPGSFTASFASRVCTALSRLPISVSSRAANSALDSSALGCPVLRQTMPEIGAPRS